MRRPSKRAHADYRIIVPVLALSWLRRYAFVPREEVLLRLEAGVQEELGNSCFGRWVDRWGHLTGDEALRQLAKVLKNEEHLEEVVGRLLLEQGKKVAVAESCTGGLVAHRLTNVPGSSAYFEQGVVAYSEAAKTTLLGVPSTLVQQHGAVSRQVAEAMAGGVRQRSQADFGLAVTGIAGPSGGTEEKPVGLVYIAIAWEGGGTSEEYRFSGDRETVKFKASQMVLDLLRRYLLGLEL